MIRLRIAPNFEGPTMEEWARLLETGPAPTEEIEVRWTGTKQDTRLLRQHARLVITLVVPDLAAMERAANYLGLPLLLEPNLLETGSRSLRSRSQSDWRAFAHRVTPSVARGVLIRLGADSIRKGKNPKTRHVASECLFEGVAPVDADVLLTLRAEGAKG
jgi:hypothetical protein